MLVLLVLAMHSTKPSGRQKKTSIQLALLPRIAPALSYVSLAKVFSPSQFRKDLVVAPPIHPLPQALPLDLTFTPGRATAEQAAAAAVRRAPAIDRTQAAARVWLVFFGLPSLLVA